MTSPHSMAGFGAMLRWKMSLAITQISYTDPVCVRIFPEGAWDTYDSLEFQWKPCPGTDGRKQVLKSRLIMGKVALTNIPPTPPREAAIQGRIFFFGFMFFLFLFDSRIVRNDKLFSARSFLRPCQGARRLLYQRRFRAIQGSYPDASLFSGNWAIGQRESSNYH